MASPGIWLRISLSDNAVLPWTNSLSQFSCWSDRSALVGGKARTASATSTPTMPSMFASHWLLFE